MQNETIYRCIDPACGRSMPRPVNFCPYCGTAQTAAARAQALGRAETADAANAAEASARRAAVAAAGAGAAASLAGWSDAPPDEAAPEAAPGATARQQPTPPAPPPAPSPTPSAPPTVAPSPARPVDSPAPPAAPSATAFGHSAGARAEAPGAAAAGVTAAGASAAPPRQGVPPPGPAAPPQREPIRLRWWILALALLWGLWLLAKPSTKKIERRIDAAVALAKECKAREAQDELIALRSSRATPEQLQRLQQALNDEAAKCTRRRQREKAWTDTLEAADAALAAGSVDKARTRLQAFTKRWGEDASTRALKARIDASRRDHPLAVPQQDAPPSTATSARDLEAARNLVREARNDIARGDYRAARGKMEMCLSMFDPGNRECRALQAEAEREGRFQ